MSRSAPQPRSRKTPRGGRMTAMMILMMSLNGQCQFVHLIIMVALLWVARPRCRNALGRTYDPVKGMLTVGECDESDQSVFSGSASGLVVVLTVDGILEL